MTTDTNMKTMLVPLQQGPEEESYMYFNGDNFGVKWTISDRALTILGHLAHVHDFGIVVDEIMTGGRTKKNNGETQTTKICIITMGKWLKCGMVLGSKRQQTIRNKLLSEQLPHGASTGINGNEAFTIYSEVVNNLENVDARRRAVLTKCRVSDKEAWGKGLHIFIPGKREGVMTTDANMKTSAWNIYISYASTTRS